MIALVIMLTAGCQKQQQEKMKIVFFKAGKADAAVVMTPSGNVLIDTGLKKNAEELVRQLKGLGISRIDHLIISHFDKDHVGGAADVIAGFEIGKVYQSNYPKDSEYYDAYVKALADKGIEALTVREDEEIQLGDVMFVINGPAEEEYEKNPSNNSSLIITFTYGKNTVVFASDAQKQRLEEYLRDYSRPEGNVILKFPYHGNWMNVLKTLVEKMKPDAAVITCSRDEPELTERMKTEELLTEANCRFYRTFEGNITAEMTRETYVINQQ